MKMQNFRPLFLLLTLLLLSSACSVVNADQLNKSVNGNSPEKKIATRTFVHPGVMHTTKSLDRMARQVKNQVQTAYASYLLLREHPLASPKFKLNGPYKIIARDGEHAGNKGRMEQDFSSIYLNTIMWGITKDKTHADYAINSMMAYAETLEQIPDTNDAPLLAGIEGFKLIYALEILKHTESGITPEQTQKITDMITGVFIPVLDKFYEKEAYTNGNWGAIVTKTYISAAILLDDVSMYNKAIDFFLHANDNGSILNYIDGQTGQIQESGRDQPHCMLGIGALATICEVAWQQGDDLYSALDNRLMKGYEYVACYNLGNSVPYKVWSDITGKYSRWPAISENGRGRSIFVFEIAYNHYVRRMKTNMPYTHAMVERNRPEGYDRDQPGFGGLLFNDDGLN
ncbi:MAG: alginate lyase family protein [Thermoguttaceae bacterium]